MDNPVEAINLIFENLSKLLIISFRNREYPIQTLNDTKK
jgi:hypothetical protein